MTDNNHRSQVHSFRLTLAEEILFHENVAESGLSDSEYIRERILSNNNTSSDLKDNRERYQRLYRISEFLDRLEASIGEAGNCQKEELACLRKEIYETCLDLSK